MDYKMLIVFYLLSGPLKASGSLYSPRELECVFFAFENVTCHWTPAVNAYSDTNYTLQVNMARRSFQCHSPKTYCSVRLNQTSLYRNYCIQVFAHSASHSLASSDTLCLNGTDAGEILFSDDPKAKTLNAELGQINRKHKRRVKRSTAYRISAKLPKPERFWLSREIGQPRCLSLDWSTADFPLTKSDTKCCLLYQLQYSTPDQPDPLPLDVDLREKVQCVFSPCTQYAVRMRYRYKHALSHWSEWSLTDTLRTDAEAPSYIPQLWRTVQAADVEGFRRVTLLWKAPLQARAACAAARFSVQCRLEGSRAAVDLEDCSNLSLANSSCQITVPPHTCICTLTMSNSAGSAPPATITIPTQWQTNQGSLVTLLVSPLNDFSLEVQWEALDFPNITGFVVEWCITAESSQCQNETRWQRVDQKTYKTIITEGVKPYTCYSVSVREVYGTRSGPGLVMMAYSRQAAPSAGPTLYAAELGCSSVLLRWSPVPLIHRRGFITKYTLCYQSEDHSAREVLVSVDSGQFALSGVSGLFRLHMKAHTDAGAGPAGLVLSLPIESCTSMQTALLTGCVFIGGVSILLCMCWRMRQRIKHSIWPKVPNPANSSISDWLY